MRASLIHSRTGQEGAGRQAGVFPSYIRLQCSQILRTSKYIYILGFRASDLEKSLEMAIIVLSG